VDELDRRTVPSTLRGRERVARILNAAAELFLKDGYAATSVDAILERSGGSKSTLYEYFSTKEELFRAAVEDIIATGAQTQLNGREDIRTALTEFLDGRLNVVLSARHCALLRLIIAEADRFPDLAEMYYERGPLRSRRSLAKLLSGIVQRKAPNAPAADEAAELLLGMAAHEWIIEFLLLGERPLPAAAIRERAERVVDQFLRAYGRL
jgi:AcrR family transcriptional regulator